MGVGAAVDEALGGGRGGERLVQLQASLYDEESEEDVEAPPQPSATGPRRLAPAFEQHAFPARGGQHHSSSRGGQHASSLRSGARRKKKGPARRAPGH